jgi:ubiquinone/menaquinone biosynthesis C-methylase UbiE
MGVIINQKRQVTTDRELAEWYDKYFGENGTWPTRQAYAGSLLRLLQEAGLADTKKKRLLDIGCGGGFFLEFVEEAFAYVSGCDISRVALAQAKERCPHLRLCQANGESLPYTNACFDVVTCLGSLEHFLHLERALAEMRRVVEPSGLVMILVPTSWEWLIHDVQPTETVMDVPSWEATFRTAGLETVLNFPTDSDESLRASSALCHVFCLYPILGER